MERRLRTLLLYVPGIEKENIHPNWRAMQHARYRKYDTLIMDSDLFGQNRVFVVNIDTLALQYLHCHDKEVEWMRLSQREKEIAAANAVINWMKNTPTFDVLVCGQTPTVEMIINKFRRCLAEKIPSLMIRFSMFYGERIPINNYPYSDPKELGFALDVFKDFGLLYRFLGSSELVEIVENPDKNRKSLIPKITYFNGGDLYAKPVLIF